MVQDLNFFTDISTDFNLMALLIILKKENKNYDFNQNYYPLTTLSGMNIIQEIIHPAQKKFVNMVKKRKKLLNFVNYLTFVEIAYF